MRKFLFLLILTGVLFGLFSAVGEAKTPKLKLRKGEAISYLKNLEDLFFISQDLDEGTNLYIKPDDACFCSCRDALWSCTDVACGVHFKECVNQALPFPQPTAQPGGF